MNLKLKALGLGLIAALAMGTVSVMGATADTGGHFTSTASHTTIHGTDISTNQTEFTVNGEGWRCETATYNGTMSGTTVTQITITPTYEGCEHDLGPIHANMNNCDYIFTVSENENTDNTFHLDCPTASGPETVITGPFGDCRITMTPDQTPSGGVAFTAGTLGGKADITANVTMSGIHSIFDGGVFVCGVSNGATREGELHGEATIGGKNTSGEAVDIAAT